LFKFIVSELDVGYGEQVNTVLFGFNVEREANWTLNMYYRISSSPDPATNSENCIIGQKIQKIRICTLRIACWIWWARCLVFGFATKVQLKYLAHRIKELIPNYKFSAAIFSSNMLQIFWQLYFFQILLREFSGLLHCPISFGKYPQISPTSPK
jgi:hypothetical protein